MKKKYIAPASERYAIQQQDMLATSLRINEGSAEQWSNRHDGWDASEWSNIDDGDE